MTHIYIAHVSIDINRRNARPVARLWLYDGAECEPTGTLRHDEPVRGNVSVYRGSFADRAAAVRCLREWFPNAPIESAINDIGSAA